MYGLVVFCIFLILCDNRTTYFMLGFTLCAILKKNDVGNVSVTHPASW